MLVFNPADLRAPVTAARAAVLWHAAHLCLSMHLVPTSLYLEVILHLLLKCRPWSASRCSMWPSSRGYWACRSGTGLLKRQPGMPGAALPKRTQTAKCAIFAGTCALGLCCCCTCLPALADDFDGRECAGLCAQGGGCGRALEVLQADGLSACLSALLLTGKVVHLDLLGAIAAIGNGRQPGNTICSVLYLRQ